MFLEIHLHDFRLFRKVLSLLYEILLFLRQTSIYHSVFLVFSLSLEQIVALNIYRFHFKTGDFENIIFSYANIADCKIAEKLAEVVKGTIFADAGYLQKKDVLKRMEEKKIKLEAAPRKNMNRLMSRFECYHIKHRSIIESDWGTLKNNFQLEYHKARSIVGMFRHFFYSIAAYMINRNLDFYQNFFRLRLI